MAFVQISNISLAFADRDILKDVTLSIASGDRIALTGANGSGKTTLMRVLTGGIQPDSGEITVSREAKVSYLPQSGLTHGGLSLTEEAEKAFEHVRKLTEELAELGEKLTHHTEDSGETERLLNQYHELQETIQESGFYSRKERIEQVLSGLGFSREDFSKKTDEFSGGWQMRIALAKILLEYPDIMLLDEPTNYLDLEATNWLQNFLSSYRGGLLLVSHDRYFLDSTVREVAELFTGRLKKYRGNFSEYQRVRNEEIRTLIEQYERQQEEIAQIESFISRFRANASKASLVQSRIKQLEKIERIEIPETMRRMRFSFPQPPHSGRMTLELNDVRKSYGTNEVLRGIDLEIPRGEKLVIVGPNGAGKSTLMRIISGREPDFSGDVKYGKDVAIGYFSQEQAEALDPEATVISELENSAPTHLIPRLRDLLAAFLFRGDDIYKSVSVLSGGERSRLSLLKLLLRPVNFLVLDEPTNHLDMNAKDVLLEALSKYSGTVVFVSHDRYFIESLATNVLELATGTEPKLYPGNYGYYLWKKESSAADEADGRGTSAAAAGTRPGANDGKPEKQLSGTAAAREELKRNKAELNRLEREEEELMLRLEELEEERSTLEHALGTPEVYTDGEKTRAAQLRLAEIEAEHDSRTQRWEEIEPELERLRNLVP